MKNGHVKRKKFKQQLIACLFITLLLISLLISGSQAEIEWVRYKQPAGNTPQSPRMYYWIYTPENAKEKLPLVIYLHSSRCMWNKALTDPLPAYISDGTISNIQAIVLVPQLVGDYDRYWRDEIDSVEAIVEQVIEDFPVDTERISLAGYSLGGIGVWDLAKLAPGRYSKILSICGRVSSTVSINDFLLCDDIRVYTAFNDQTINSSTAIAFANELSEKGVHASVSTLDMKHREVPLEIFKDSEVLQWLWLIPSESTNKGASINDKIS